MIIVIIDCPICWTADNKCDGKPGDTIPPIHFKRE